MQKNMLVVQIIKKHAEHILKMTQRGRKSRARTQVEYLGWIADDAAAIIEAAGDFALELENEEEGGAE